MSIPAPDVLPLTVIAGYLGAGKTTLVNQILIGAEGRRIMVLVNDFGDIAIDAELITARDGDVISLSNGCVCCAIGGDLFQAFAKALDAHPRPDHLVIEASGVAEPDRIANFARAEPDLRLDAIITVVDAMNVRAHANDPLIGTTIMNQFAAAGLLLVTKHDLCTTGHIEDLTHWLESLCKDTPVVFTPADTDILLGPIPNKQTERLHRPGEQHSHEETYARWSFENTHAPDASKVSELMKNLPTGILRLKGICTTSTGSFAFHSAGIHTEIHPLKNSSANGISAVAIGLDGLLPVTELDTLFNDLCRSAQNTRKAS